MEKALENKMLAGVAHLSDCPCKGCRLARAAALGIGPPPWGPEEWKRLGGDVVIPLTPDERPSHVQRAMSKFDRPIAEAERAVDEASEVYTAAELGWMEAGRRLAALEAERAGPLRITITGQPVPYGPTRAVISAAENAVAEALEAREEAGAALLKARAAHSGLWRRQDNARRQAQDEGPGGVLAALKRTLGGGE